MNTEALKEAGLTEGEVKVYVALLELGTSTTGKIVERSHVAKSIVYQILEKLLQKGLVSIIVKKKTKHYQAASPKKLLEYIDERKTQLELNRRKINAIIPELLLKQTMSTQSEARLYFGFKGMVTAHEHFYDKLSRGEEYVYLGIPAYQPKEHHLYWKRDHIRREEAGIKGRMLFNADTDPVIVKQRNTYPGAEARLMASDVITPAMIMVYKDTTMISVQDPEKVTVEIVNQQVADSFKAYFEEYWKRSKPFKK